MRYKSTLGVTILALCIAGVALAGPFERQISREFNAAGLSDFRLDNLAGKVTIQGGSGDKISVRATIYSEDHDGLSASEVSDLLEVEVVQDGDRLEIKSRYPLSDYRRIHYGAEKKGFFSGSNSTVRIDGKKVKITTGRRGGGLPLWVDYEITLPPGLDTDLRNYVGNVRFSDVRGNCRADLASADFVGRNQRGDLMVDNGSGDIKVTDMTGTLKVDTGSGDVEVENLTGNFDGDTGSGDIELRDGNGESLKADTGSGEVVLLGVDYPRLHVDTGSGDVRVSTPGGEVANWEVDTGSGDVTFLFPTRGTSFQLTADTGSGDVECDLETTNVTMRHGEIRALKVGGGEGRILVDTGSGDIILREGS